MSSTQSQDHTGPTTATTNRWARIVARPGLNVVRGPEKPQLAVEPIEPVVSPEIASNPSGDPSPAMSQRNVGPIGVLSAAISNLIDQAAGYDEKVLSQYGTPTDQKRRRNIGRAILVATVVGSLGWFAKILMSYPGWLAFPLAVIMGSLYAVLSYSLESFFASNVDPFASVPSKILSLFGRVLLSAVIAFAGALPWVTVALKGAVQVEVSKMAVEQQSTLRRGLDDAYGVTALDNKANAYTTELKNWEAAIAVLPAQVQSALDLANACTAEYEKSKASSEAVISTLKKRMGVLEKLAQAENGTDLTRRAAGIERDQISRSMTKLSQELLGKKSQCQSMRQDAETQRLNHVNFASQQRDASQKQLADLRREESAISGKVQSEKMRVNELISETAQSNASAEFSALIRIIQSELYAKLLALLIFTGLLLVDSLPLTLRLFAKPGPYDAEKRTDDAIKNMRAEGRLLEAQMMHAARRREMESEELQRIVQADCRPHIRSIALNGLNGFLRKQAKA